MKKTLTRVEIKDADQGLIEAVFCTLGVVDKDGDVIVKGAFDEGAAVVISAYGHMSWEGELPVGYGTIHEIGDEAVLKGQFFLNTDHGRNTWETVKELSKLQLQEWSYSLHDVKASSGTVDGRKVRIIEKNTVKEVSPVLRGAGVATRTVDVKANLRGDTPQDLAQLATVTGAGLALGQLADYAKAGNIRLASLAAVPSTKQLASSIRRLLVDAASKRWPDPDTYVWVHDYDLDEGYVVYSVDAWDDTEERYCVCLTQVDIVARTDTSIELGETETEVHPTTVFLPKSAKFSEHTAVALRAVKGLTEMAVQRLALRAEQGKSVDQQVAAHEQLLTALEPLKAAIDALPTSQSIDDELEREYARFVSLSTKEHTQS